MYYSKANLPSAVGYGGELQSEAYFQDDFEGLSLLLFPSIGCEDWSVALK